MKEQFRKFWIKKGYPSQQGAYVAYTEAREKDKELPFISRDTIREYVKEFNNTFKPIKNKPSILYFDIETTSLSAGFGHILMFAYCYQDNPDDVKVVTLLDNPDYIKLPPEKCDFFLVQELKRLVDEADVHVGHYSTKFDEKFLRTRLLIHGLQLPDHKWKSSFDTCITAWKKFKMGGKLKVIARAMGCDNQKDELPLTVWQRSQCVGYEPYFSEAIKEMAEYCKQDVRTLYDIAQPMFPLAKHLPSYQAITGKPGVSCPVVNCGSEEIEYVGIDPTKSGAYLQYRCKHCGATFRTTQDIRHYNKDEKVTY